MVLTLAASQNRLQLNDPRDFNEDIINEGVRIKRDKTTGAPMG